MYNEEILKIYVIEMKEIIQILKESINLLQEDSQNEEARRMAYVNYHKLKGNSAIIGLDYLRQFCYLFETYLKKNGEISDEILKLLRESNDTFNDLYDTFQQGEFVDLDIELVNTFKKQLNK